MRCFSPSSPVEHSSHVAAGLKLTRGKVTTAKGARIPDSISVANQTSPARSTCRSVARLHFAHGIREQKAESKKHLRTYAQASATHLHTAAADNTAARAYRALVELGEISREARRAKKREIKEPRQRTRRICIGTLEASREWRPGTSVPGARVCQLSYFAARVMNARGQPRFRTRPFLTALCTPCVYPRVPYARARVKLPLSPRA